MKVLDNLEINFIYTPDSVPSFIWRRWYSLNFAFLQIWSCPLKWANERNPHHMLNSSYETAPLCGEEGADDVKSARLLHPGLHTPYNGEKQRAANW